MRLAPLTRMEHPSGKEWFPVATLPIGQALAYLDALEADRMAALALSEQKTEEAKLIKARQEGFRAALDILCGETSAGDAVSGKDREPSAGRMARSAARVHPGLWFLFNALLLMVCKRPSGDRRPRQSHEVTSIRVAILLNR